MMDCLFLVGSELQSRMEEFKYLGVSLISKGKWNVTLIGIWVMCQH